MLMRPGGSKRRRSASDGFCVSWMASTSHDLGDLVRRGYRFALSLTHDPARADDLIQDAWFAVLRVRGPWNRDYLFTTIRNRFIDQYRRDGRMNIGSLDEMSDAECVAESQSENGDEWVFSGNGALDDALGRLRDEERAVLYLAAVENFTAQRIADLLQWPRGTVLSMLHRARGKLKQMVQNDSSMKT